MPGSARMRWRAAALLGILSSSFSTVVSQLAAARLGRDASVDWMSVAAIPVRDWAISAEPSAIAIAIGIVFHQLADFSWALSFFGVLGRWTANLKPTSLALLALPWAALTSSLEWFVLVPLVPFWQPIFPLQQPLWIGFFVHLSSAVVYPLYPALLNNRRLAAGEGRFLLGWTGALSAFVLALGMASVLARNDIELRWMGKDLGADQAFIRHMSTHHQQGIALARLAADRASDPHLRSIARLMMASQAGERRILQDWWSRWFEASMPVCSSAETASMPGYLTDAQLVAVRDAPQEQFDAAFIAAMTRHHAGAVRMAEDELQTRSDPRLRIMSYGIRHSQQGEVALMHGASGLAAVRMATLQMVGNRLASAAD